MLLTIFIFNSLVTAHRSRRLTYFDARWLSQHGELYVSN
jgi:hypothetical protein